ncbi:MAG TPA: hypothetical protein VHC18_28610 [Amycolatopsis sp.]|nr:hypothetical protein [Amycolatopsis sp.]
MSGVSVAGLMTTAFPAMSAGASLRAGVRNGSFHGVMSSTTPSGSWICVAKVPGRASGNSSP